MPRIRTSTNDPIDYCIVCFPSETTADDEFGDMGDGPDNRGNCFCYDDEHPPYDFENYVCYNCRIELTSENA